MNLNPIDFNYIDGKNTYPIQDYIDDKISCNNIYITSNTFSSNINLNNNQKLDSNLFYDTSNLFVCNSNPFGEIYFKTFYNYPNSNNYGIKIDYTGKLFVYHKYNILQPTFFEGYYDVESEILQLKADGINTDGQLSILDAGLVYVKGQIDGLLQAGNLIEGKLNSLINNIDVALNNQQLTELNQALTYGEASTRYADIITNLGKTSSKLYYNSLYTGLAITAGIGLAGAAIGAISSQIYYFQASNAIMRNSNLTSNQQYTLYSNNTSNEILNYSNVGYSLSNLNLNQGFLNCNIVAQQYINSLKCNSITLNNKTITKFSLESIDNWVKTTNGWYWDATLGNLGINGTPNTQDFLIVGGQTTIQGDLITQKKFINTNTSVALPSTSASGGLGDKLILKSGGVGFYPYSLGINTNSLWFSVPSGANHTFYVNGNSSALITSTGMAVNGVLNATTLQENSINLSSKYDRILYFAHPLLRDGNNNITFDTSVFYSASQCDLKFLRLDGTNSMSGTLNGTTITASSNFVENGQNLSSKYLLLNGINSMSGNLNGTNINAVNNLQENFINISSKYLLLNGTNSMSGTLNGTSGIFNGNVCIGTSAPVSVNTKLSISGTSSGFSQPLVNIQQLGAWDGNYALQVSGYTNLNGMRIGGSDSANTIYQTTSNSDIGISQFPSAINTGSINLTVFGSGTIKFFTNGANERMRINSLGNVGIGTNNPNSKLDIRGNFSVSTGVWNISSDGVYRTHYGANDVSYYCCGSGSTTGHMFMNSSYANVMTIYNNGNVGINSSAPRSKLDVNGIVNFHNGTPFASEKMSAGSLTIGGQDFNYGGQFFPSGNWIGTNTAGLMMECADNTEIVIHDAGMRLASFMYYQGGASANRFTMGRNMGWTGGASIFHFSGSVGINNPTPISSGILTFLSVGNAGSTNSEGTICIGKNTGGGSTRQYRIGYTDDYSWCIGDYGNNNIAGTWIQQVYCTYSSPVASLFINVNGYCTMQYGYGGGSDIKIKTHIRTIDDALWKVKQLRGIYYTHITEGTKGLGLIAQEVEHIIPEAVYYDETNDLKSISYQNLVGLLINAIKEQDEIINKQAKQFENIMDILNRNNIK